jgi:hypothetical protein
MESSTFLALLSNTRGVCYLFNGVQIIANLVNKLSLVVCV